MAEVYFDKTCPTIELGIVTDGNIVMNNSITPFSSELVYMYGIEPLSLSFTGNVPYIPNIIKYTGYMDSAITMYINGYRILKKMDNSYYITMSASSEVYKWAYKRINFEYFKIGGVTLDVFLTAIENSTGWTFNSAAKELLPDFSTTVGIYPSIIFHGNIAESLKLLENMTGKNICLDHEKKEIILEDFSVISGADFEMVEDKNTIIERYWTNSNIEKVIVYGTLNRIPMLNEDWIAQAKNGAGSDTESLENDYRYVELKASPLEWSVTPYSRALGAPTLISSVSEETETGRTKTINTTEKYNSAIRVVVYAITSSLKQDEVMMFPKYVDEDTAKSDTEDSDSPFVDFMKAEVNFDDMYEGDDKEKISVDTNTYITMDSLNARIKEVANIMVERIKGCESGDCEESQDNNNESPADSENEIKSVHIIFFKENDASSADALYSLGAAVVTDIIIGIESLTKKYTEQFINEKSQGREQTETSIDPEAVDGSAISAWTQYNKLCRLVFKWDLEHGQRVLFPFAVDNTGKKYAPSTEDLTNMAETAEDGTLLVPTKTLGSLEAAESYANNIKKMYDNTEIKGYLVENFNRKFSKYTESFNDYLIGVGYTREDKGD